MNNLVKLFSTFLIKIISNLIKHYIKLITGISMNTNLKLLHIYNHQSLRSNYFLRSSQPNRLISPYKMNPFYLKVKSKN